MTIAILAASASSILRNLKIVDPACGSGAFLVPGVQRARKQRYFEVIGHLEQLDADGGGANWWHQVPHVHPQDNLYGVDLSPEAVEITQLALWIRSATPGPDAGDALAEHRPRQFAGPRRRRCIPRASIGTNAFPGLDAPLVPPGEAAGQESPKPASTA